MAVVREVQGLEDNVHQLDCDGLALTLICMSLGGNQPVEKADPPRCEGIGLLKGNG